MIKSRLKGSVWSVRAQVLTTGAVIMARARSIQIYRFDIVLQRITVLKGLAGKTYQLIFLWLMKDGPVYGYDLVARFEKMTGRHIKMSYGTMYPFLRRMEKKGVISSKKDESSGRVYYELTTKGKRALEDLSERLEESQEYFNEKLLGFLAIYIELFGKDDLAKVLKRA